MIENNYKEYRASIVLEWQIAWRNTQFRTLMFIGIALVTLIFIFCPYFFQAIEHRPGKQLIDPILPLIPSQDVSAPTFIIIWFFIGLAVFRSVCNPQMFVTILYSGIFVFSLRFLTLSLIPLEPPKGLIPFIDPISNLTYGHADYITKDLFFSGHTSSMFLIYLNLQKKSEKTLALIATVVVGILVLVQHVHYTIDVLAAPFFCYFCYRLSKRITTLDL
jgi:dolichol kinase